MMSFKKNFYKSLGLQKNATLAEVQKAYREAARHLHPDVNTEAGATEHFIHIKEAYETLSNPQKRQTQAGGNRRPTYPHLSCLRILQKVSRGTAKRCPPRYGRPSRRASVPSDIYSQRCLLKGVPLLQ